MQGVEINWKRHKKTDRGNYWLIPDLHYLSGKWKFNSFFFVLRKILFIARFDVYFVQIFSQQCTGAENIILSYIARPCWTIPDRFSIFGIGLLNELSSAYRAKFLCFAFFCLFFFLFVFFANINPSLMHLIIKFFHQIL